MSETAQYKYQNPPRKTAPPFSSRHESSNPAFDLALSPHPSSIHKIKQYADELRKIRVDITADLSREADIIQQLKQTNAPPLPDNRDQDSFGTSLDDLPVLDAAREVYFIYLFTVMKIRLERIHLELNNERRKRLEAEDALKGIARERRAPFVVPALLEAFISISKLTTQALA